MTGTTGRRIFMIAGEHSGDQLGGKLIGALRAAGRNDLSVSGVGGEAMAAEGCRSIFPLSDVAVMGPAAIAARLPHLVRRVYQTVDAAVDARPDALVIIDSPEFTHPIARRVRRRIPRLPVIDYVSPSVWAWRPGRAKRMRAYIDHVLALLPFEPAAHVRLGGPKCSYVGHPLVERLGWISAQDPQALATELSIVPGRPVIVVLPGSRTNEVKRLMQPFGEALRILADRHGPLEVILPAVGSVRHLIDAQLEAWPVRPHVVTTEAEKFQSFRLADAALAASGTVTLELALSGTPMVVGYRLDAISARLRWLANFPSFVLPNLVLEENAFPEYLHETCRADILAEAMSPLLVDGPERRAQLKALARIREVMQPDAASPSERAAEIVLSYSG